MERVRAKRFTRLEFGNGGGELDVGDVVEGWDEDAADAGGCAVVGGAAGE